MIDQTLLDILVCPESKQTLSVADPALLEELNAAIQEGKVVNRGGVSLTEAMTEGLVREDGAVLYPVRDDIPIMLIQESIPLPQTA